MREIFDTVGRAIRGMKTPDVNAQSVYNRCKVGPIFFDQRNGHGAAGITAQFAQRGFIAMMKPSQFFNMIGDDISKFSDDKFYTQYLRAGQPIASPYLSVRFSSAFPEVMGHEGRNRMGVIANLYSDMNEMPVGIHVVGPIERRDLTEHHITSLAGPIITQLDTKLEYTGIKTVFFGNRHCNLNQLKAKSVLEDPSIR